MYFEKCTQCKETVMESEFFQPADMCKRCYEELLDVGIKPLKNFSVAPKLVTCSECGNWFHQEEIAEHLPCKEVDA